MRIKKSIFSLFVLFFVLSLSIFNGTAFADTEKIYLGGYPAGFSLYTRGAYVLGVCDVVTDEGVVSPCKKAGILVGDTILSIDESEINTALDIEKAVVDDSIKTLVIKRNDETVFANIKPAKDINGKYRLGVFVRDTVNGIGTITYIKGDRFASLGHPVVDETGENLQIRGGSLCFCTITGSVRGERGKAGELRGAFLKKNRIATIEKNIDQGVYGKIDVDIEKDFELREIEVGKASVGDATIYSTIDGNEPIEYKISIVKIDSKPDCRNFVIKIKDRRLLEQTGGIVQGMSGSPVVQNGKLVGAVTHVFINDPTRGFGISIQNMINN